MPPVAIDIFCHYLPPEYVAAANRLLVASPQMFRRAQTIRGMVDISARLKMMDRFPGYCQVLSLASPPPETLGDPHQSAELARIANDSLARIVATHRHRVPAFVAAIPCNHPTAALAEAERALTRLGAAGVQVSTSVGGEPLDRPEMLAVFELVASLGRAVWLHPARPSTKPDYEAESVSKFDLWWAFGWPHETSVAMGRLVFAGVFDRWPDLVVVAHHAGGTVPMLAGRIAFGLERLGTRDRDEAAGAGASCLKEKPVEAFRRFHADTASFGSRATLECAAAFFGTDRMLFATDMPFGPNHGVANVRATLGAIDAMDLSASQRQAILCENAKRILDLGD